MPPVECEPEVASSLVARECLYRFFAALASGPYAAAWSILAEPDTHHLAAEAANIIRAEAEGEPIPLGLGERPAHELTCAALLDELQKPLAELRTEFDRVFGLVTPRECPPYETEYHPNSETFFRSQQMADIAGFYRAFGIEPAHAVLERPDHLALELEFMAFLLMKQRLAAGAAQPSNAADQAEVCLLAQQSFFRDHVIWWVPAFAKALERKAGDGYNAAFARMLAAFIPLERRRLGIDAHFKPIGPDLIELPEEQPACGSCPLNQCAP